MTRDRTFPQPLVRFSELKSMARSPAHYRAAVLHGREPSPAMRFGTLCHTLILGGDRFAVFEGKTRQGKAWDAFEAHHAGKLIVKRSELEDAMSVARRVWAHPIAGPLVKGRTEVELTWETLGRKCGGRLDVIGDTFITDLKMSASSEPEWFTRNATRLAYHAQLAWYKEGALANGCRVDDVFLVAVEPKEPYAITPMRMHLHAIGKGDQLCRLWLERLIGCEAVNEWPEYTQSIATFDVPDDLELTYGEDSSEEEAA